MDNARFFGQSLIPNRVTRNVSLQTNYYRDNMKRVLRVLITFISGVAAFYSAIYFVLWADGAWLANIQLPVWISLVTAVGACAIVGRYAWTRTESVQHGIAASIIMGALIMGGIGFVAGFFGPMIFSPDNNLGPMLGIFTTGPLGFVVGGVAGCVYWLVRRLLEK